MFVDRKSPSTRYISRTANYLAHLALTLSFLFDHVAGKYEIKQQHIMHFMVNKVYYKGL